MPVSRPYRVHLGRRLHGRPPRGGPPHSAPPYRSWLATHRCQNPSSGRPSRLKSSLTGLKRWAQGPSWCSAACGPGGAAPLAAHPFVRPAACRSLCDRSSQRRARLLLSSHPTLWLLCRLLLGGLRWLLPSLPISRDDVLCGSMLAASTYSAVQDRRHTDGRGDATVTHTRLDGLLRSLVTRHGTCRSVVVL